MKVNAPEKIYIQPNAHDEWFESNPNSDIFVEYTRTDVFIDKVHMRKAEKRALEAYPEDIKEFVDVNGVRSVVDNNSWQRTIFLKGYQQAEEDLELTLEDVYDIWRIYNEVCAEGKIFGFDETSQEVLKRFKEYKRQQANLCKI